MIPLEGDSTTGLNLPNFDVFSHTCPALPLFVLFPISLKVNSLFALQYRKNNMSRNIIPYGFNEAEFAAILKPQKTH
ncbi:uncharacterized protein BDR25DRAFT_350108 [Lindgomyces ingoldianus]|uniref:Uncharacterized protein n=1 Tax=Lindgomyces ingoldianus TaxID=673940 RepID=A0ACB6R9J7_9PLEO|nr:uncharacterized protein BDR25DRAFT_350108 [Lindgomyces ingoldianus]KAF2475826.1 hypothetical protein BDR25DRAFT_350108 [Lindgomyces ingoldianus]